MKNKNLLILFVIYNFLFIASLRVNAQWDRTYQVTSIMQAVHFINNSTGWMVGVGDLYKTTNSGISWNAYLSPSGGFSDVEFLNDNTGFMVQGSSVVYKTTNSGINWTTTNINQGSFRCIASSNNILWIAGGSGRLYKSTNFGVNWIDQSLSIQFLITNIQFVNSTTGWFLNSNGEIYRTTNGGTNWDFQLVSQLNSIFFTDINYGWGVGASTYRNIIKTTNGGINWIDLVIDPDSSRLNYLSFINQNTGWIIGDAGTILKTTNAGTSWNNQTIIDRPDNFAGIYCTGLSEGVIIGRAGTAGVVYKYKPTLLVFPNGNQTLLTNFICDIKWICDVEQNVKIEYTTNDGANWITIINSIQGSIGHYYWTIPPNASTQCKVKVTNLNNPNYYDESNSTFTIALPIRNAQLLKDTVITELPCYVNVLFHSLDQNNVGIENLFKEEFKIQEDNVQISPNESRLQIGKANVLNYTYKSVLLLDNSTSISPLDLQIIKQGAIGFVRNKLPAQQIALYVFSENTILLQDFTTDTTALINSINSIQLGLPSTNLYGSLITGLSRWQDRYDLNNFEFGNLVVLTDGEDTQGSSTLQQVLNARKNKRVVTIGLGNQINPGILQQIGNAGFYQVTNINLLISNFILIQQNFIKFLNSFYWLNYTSPKRGNNNHVLKVSLFNNQNTDTTSYITAVFNSNGFYSVIPGIVVNATPTNPYGVDTIFIPANANVLVTIETPFTFNRQPYQFLIANPQLLNIQPGGTPTQFRFLGTAQPGLNTNVIINDTANGYTKTLHVEFGPVGINTISSAVPDKFSLSQNYPNPFNPSTKIKFDISTTSLVKINLFDIIGREIEGLVNEILTPGSYEIILNSNNLSSGIYYYKIEAKDFIKTKKMILLK